MSVELNDINGSGRRIIAAIYSGNRLPQDISVQGSAASAVEIISFTPEG